MSFALRYSLTIFYVASCSFACFFKKSIAYWYVIMALKKQKKRRICFVITSFIHYSRNMLILDELLKRKDVDLHVLVGGTALLSKYSSKFAHIKELLRKDGHRNIHELYFNLEGDSSVIKAKTVGLGIIEFTSFFNDIKPDLVVVRGDRFEILAAAVAAAYMQIPVAHIEGGDTTGSIDESVRHAVTKLSHIHFATNEPAYKRVLKLGEHPDYVFNFGSPDVELVSKLVNGKLSIDLAKTGSGFPIDLKTPYLLVMYHPDASDLKNVSKNTRSLLKVVHRMNLPAIWFWPNFDAGAEDISHELRVFRDTISDHKIKFSRYLPPRDFLVLLKNTLCLIGNSSAGIKESSFLGIPVVNIGGRQGARLRAGNVHSVSYDEKEIENGIIRQIAAGRFPVSNLYFTPDTSKKIAKTLATIPLYFQKKFVD